MSIEENEVFRALVGSHNYNINDSDSDLDYKAMTYPTFDDLYTSNMAKTSIITNEVDIETHDIRRFVGFLMKSNPAYLEILFSKDIEFGENAIWETGINSIFENRNRIVKMNLKGLFNASMGMHKQKYESIKKGTENTQHLIAKYGYCTKNATHSYRMLDLLERFRDTDFNDFGSALWYDDSDSNREVIMNIKYGKYSELEFRNIIDYKRARAERLKDDYFDDSNLESESIRDTFESILQSHIKTLVENSIKRELSLFI